MITVYNLYVRIKLAIKPPKNQSQPRLSNEQKNINNYIRSRTQRKYNTVCENVPKDLIISYFH
jgi:hypothetical protein